MLPRIFLRKLVGGGLHLDQGVSWDPGHEIPPRQALERGWRLQEREGQDQSRPVRPGPPGWGGGLTPGPGQRPQSTCDGTLPLWIFFVNPVDILQLLSYIFSQMHLAESDVIHLWLSCYSCLLFFCQVFNVLVFISNSLVFLLVIFSGQPVFPIGLSTSVL